MSKPFNIQFTIAFVRGLATVLCCLVFGVTEIQATDFLATASVTATFPELEGPVRTATAEFSFVFTDDFLNGASVGDQGDFPVTSFSTSLNPVGNITYDTSNVEGYVFYNQGSLRQILVGGVGPTVLDENSVGGNSDDLYVSLSILPNGELDDTFDRPGRIVYSTTDEIAVYNGVVTSGSLTIVVVPEPGTLGIIGFAAFAGCAAQAVRRRGRNKRR